MKLNWQLWTLMIFILMISACSHKNTQTEWGKAHFTEIPLTKEMISISPWDEKNVDGVDISRFTINTGNGFPVSGLLFEGTSDPNGNALLFCHWLGGVANIDRGAEEFFDEAAAYAKAGFICAVPEGYFPWMASPRDAENDLLALEKQIQDYKAVMDLMETRRKIKSWGIVGHDYGGMHALLLSLADNRIDHLVLMTIIGRYIDWNRIITYMPEGEKLDSYNSAFQPYDPFTALPEINVPLYLQFGNIDEYVSDTDMDEIRSVLPAQAELDVYAHGHNLNRNIQAYEDRKNWIQDKMYAGQ